MPLVVQVVAAELLEVSLPTAKSEDCKQNSYIVQEGESGMDSSSVWQNEERSISSLKYQKAELRGKWNMTKLKTASTIAESPLWKSIC